MPSVPSSSVAPCSLFDNLPAELRNSIYELSFTSDNQDTEINLLKATPPSKALLLTCQQANSESKGLYEDAYRKYWTETKFVIDGHGKEPYERQARAATKASLSAMRDEDLQHIRRICVTKTYKPKPTKRTMVDPRGGWVFSSSPPSKLEALGYTLYFVAAIGAHGRPLFNLAMSHEEMEENLSKNSVPISMKWQLLSLTTHIDDQFVDEEPLIED